MSELKERLKNIFGREPSGMELKAFACYDTDSGNRRKHFRRYSESKPLYLNLDDDHYLYISHHTNRLRCRIDMATRHLDTNICYPHGGGSIMAGISHPGRERRLRSRHVNYRIFVQPARQEDEKYLHGVSAYADHMALIQDESPWERLCRVCTGTAAGCHITASAARLFSPYENGLLYFVPEHQQLSFKKAAAGFDQQPQFIGKTVPYPIVSLDNEDGLLEVPVSTLKMLQESMMKYTEDRTPYRESTGKNVLPEAPASDDSNIEKLLTLLKEEEAEYPPQEYATAATLPDLRIDPFPLCGPAFSVNGIELHTLSAIVDLYARGLKPLALSFYMESKATLPQKLDPLTAAVRKSAELFDIPVANNCIVPGEHNDLKLFFVSTAAKDAASCAFREAGDFICLLGDPSGTLNGSAYTRAVTGKSRFSPPGVMRGTIAALVNVLEECRKQDILSSVCPVQRGGLFYALYRSCSPGFGASVYSERKSPPQVFVFGEPQAALLVSIKEKDLIGLARITSNFNLTSTTIGRVREEKVIDINNIIRYDLRSGKTDTR